MRLCIYDAQYISRAGEMPALTGFVLIEAALYIGSDAGVERAIGAFDDVCEIHVYIVCVK